MGLFNRNREKQSDIEAALKYLQEEYPRIEREFKKKLDDSSARIDSLSRDFERKTSTLEEKIDAVDQKLNSIFGRENPKMEQRQSIHDYWTKSSEVANIGMTPEAGRDAERKLAEIMAQGEGKSR